MNGKLWVKKQIAGLCPAWKATLAQAALGTGIASAFAGAIAGSIFLFVLLLLVSIACVAPFAACVLGGGKNRWRRWETLHRIKRELDMGAGSVEYEAAAKNYLTIESLIGETAYDDDLKRSVTFEMNVHMNRIVDLTFVAPQNLQMSAGQALRVKRDSFDWMTRLRTLIEETVIQEPTPPQETDLFHELETYRAAREDAIRELVQTAR